ncbi:hypothetical protein FACS1894159_01130 [Bacteroidia bacterium]|nr:hypothetical protein FACS1894159_01130 [Bacteroidia bacterium]
MENNQTLSSAYIWRAVLSIALGLALVVWPSFTADYIIVIIGALLLLTGFVATIVYYSERGGKKQVGLGFPIGGLLYLVGGILLVAMPGVFRSILVMVLGILLIFAAADQIYILIQLSRRGMKVSPWRYLSPALIGIVGIIMVVNPQRSLETMLTVFGVTLIVYGITDLVAQVFIKRSAN